MKKRHPSYARHASSRYDMERQAFRSLEDMVETGSEIDYDGLELRLTNRISRRGGMLRRMIEKEIPKQDEEPEATTAAEEKMAHSELYLQLVKEKKGEASDEPIDFLNQMKVNDALRRQIIDTVDIGAAQQLSRVTRNHAYLYGRLNAWANKGKQELREDTRDKVIGSLRSIATSINKESPGSAIVALTGSTENFSLLYKALDPTKHPREALRQETKDGSLGTIDEDKKAQLQRTWERLREFGHILDVE